MSESLNTLKELLVNLDGGPYILALGIVLISWLSYLFSCRVILQLLKRIFQHTQTHLDDILIERGVLNRLAYAVPLLVIYLFADLFPDFGATIQQYVSALFVVVVTLVINAMLDAVNDIYRQSKFSQQFNIKSYLQITKLILNILAAIIVISILIDKSPIYLLSGIGALTAVLLLIFKDTILSFVASIQIHSNDLFKLGDWLEAPQFGADGDVIDIALHTVKIQNWDKTISIIPTHKLISSSFKNWRGMSESGGRRIKRALYIDQNSIRLCNEAMLKHFKSIELLAPYLDTKLTEINSENTQKKTNLNTLVNGRRLTNIGSFRAYIEAYLKHHPMIHNKHTRLVRQLAPSEHGIAIEIYVFTNVTEWKLYESIQADIFDHLLAVLSEFHLRVFQNPTGQDFKLSH